MHRGIYFILVNNPEALPNLHVCNYWSGTKEGSVDGKCAPLPTKRELLHSLDVWECGPV